MPDKAPPAYKFRVTRSGHSHFFVEAAYSAIEDTGHMVLKNADGNPVFTAEPGTRCTFERREKAAADDGGPGPVSFAAFEEAWGKACTDAWDDGRRHPVVLLPDFMWPGVASMVNPVSGEPATVTRVRTFPVQGEPGDEDHWTEETLVRLTHSATGKSAEAPTRDEAAAMLARRLTEDGDISVSVARRMHGLKPFGMPEAGRGRFHSRRPSLPRRRLRLPGLRVKPATQAARLAAAPAADGPPPDSALARAPGLLAAVADALNACDEAGITARLAHGAVLTDAGYVLRLALRHGPGFAGDLWQVRTLGLTEFPQAAPGDDFDD